MRWIHLPFLLSVHLPSSQKVKNRLNLNLSLLYCISFLHTAVIIIPDVPFVLLYSALFLSSLSNMCFFLLPISFFSLFLLSPWPPQSSAVPFAANSGPHVTHLSAQFGSVHCCTPHYSSPSKLAVWGQQSHYHASTFTFILCLWDDHFLSTFGFVIHPSDKVLEDGES